MRHDRLGYPVFLLKGEAQVVLADGTVKALFVPADTLVLKAWVVCDLDPDDATVSVALGDSTTANGWRAATGMDVARDVRAGTLDSNTYYGGKHYRSDDWLTALVAFSGDGVGEVHFHIEALCAKVW